MRGASMAQNVNTIAETVRMSRARMHVAVRLSESWFWHHVWESGGWPTGTPALEQGSTFGILLFWTFMCRLNYPCTAIAVSSWMFDAREFVKRCSGGSNSGQKKH